MEKVNVKSTNIETIGFEEDIRIALNSKPTTRLYIKFLNGLSYYYYGVSKETFNEFKNAESVGSYFHQNINKKYNYERTE